MTRKSEGKKMRAAQTLGRLGGSQNTAKQNAARKANAQLAGRPKRVCNFCGDRVTGGHANRSKDVTCGAHGWHWQKPHEEAKNLINPYDVLDAMVKAFDQDHQIDADHASIIVTDRWSELLQQARLAVAQRDGTAGQ